VLGVLSSAFNGEMLLKGRSMFAGAKGEDRGADRRAVDDPTDAMFGAPVYDSEGATRRNS
jgi:predicted Zn-dependent protease